MVINDHIEIQERLSEVGSSILWNNVDHVWKTNDLEQPELMWRIRHMRKRTKNVIIYIRCYHLFLKDICLYSYRKTKGRIYIKMLTRKAGVDQGRWETRQSWIRGGARTGFVWYGKMGVEEVAGRYDGVDGNEETKFGWDFRDNLLFRFVCVLESANLSSSPYSTTK